MLTILQCHDYWSYYLQIRTTEKLLNKMLHVKRFCKKLGMVQVSDDCFHLYCFFTGELGKQRTILRRILH